MSHHNTITYILVNVDFTLFDIQTIALLSRKEYFMHTSCKITKVNNNSQQLYCSVNE